MLYHEHALFVILTAKKLLESFFKIVMKKRKKK